jgi:ethanolamine utilization protein EutL
VKVFPPPSETNFASAWLGGDLPACQAAAEAYAEAVVRVAAEPRERRFGAG